MTPPTRTQRYGDRCFRPAATKGYGLGLLVEVLASALTGSRSSVDIPSLKAPEGPHHDIGQFYIVVDPKSFSDGAFFNRIEALAEAVSGQPGARRPGSDRDLQKTVELEADVWELAQSLAR
jgi:(2R)-3-sulfolactate dehydrogenase (NADP+)